MKKSSTLFIVLMGIYSILPVRQAGIQPINLSAGTLVKEDQSIIAQTKQTAFINGKIYTVNENQPYAEAVIVEGNKIKLILK